MPLSVVRFRGEQFEVQIQLEVNKIGLVDTPTQEKPEVVAH